MALKDSYLSLITSQHRDKPKFMAMVSDLLESSDQIFEVATFFDDEFDLDYAAGTQQDILGEIIGQSRALGFNYDKDLSSVLDDEAYRVIQKAKIIRNLWDGQIGNLYEKWLNLFGAPIRVKDNQDMTMDVLLDINESSEMQKLMKLTAKGLIVPKPMGVGINYKFYYPPIHLPIKIHHTAEITGVVDAHHCIWNLGTARTIRWDGEFNFDRSIRFDVYGDQYKDRQQHQAEILIIVEAWQRNLVPVNIFDGAFCMDGNHTWRGMSLQRLPLHKTDSQGIATAVHKDAAKISNQVATMSCPNIYLANPIKHDSSNIIKVDAKYNIDYRTVNLADGSFCCDGSHAFDGTQQQNIADVTNYCTITRITKNGIGRIERV